MAAEGDLGRRRDFPELGDGVVATAAERGPLV